MCNLILFKPIFACKVLLSYWGTYCKSESLPTSFEKCGMPIPNSISIYLFFLYSCCLRLSTIYDMTQVAFKDLKIARKGRNSKKEAQHYICASRRHICKSRKLPIQLFPYRMFEKVGIGNFNVLMIKANTLNLMLMQ